MESTGEELKMATCETISTLLDGCSTEAEGKYRGKPFCQLEMREFSSRETFDGDSSDNLTAGATATAASLAEVAAVHSRRRMSVMEAVTMPLARLRNSRVMSRRLTRYRHSVGELTRRVVRADRTWVGCMMAMSTVDVVLNLTNFVSMSNENLNFGLVIGPPSKELWYVLMGFTVVSWLLYMPETVNTLSVLFSPSGETFMPLPYEMAMALVLKHIPLTAVVYFIGKCRRDFTTALESACNAFRIVHILARLIWHAHMEGGKLRRDPKRKTGKTVVLLCCLLYGVSTSFAIKNWRSEPGRVLRRYHLINVSIVMLSENHIAEKPFPPERLFFSLELSDLVRLQGYDVERPWLVRSILSVRELGSLAADYNCKRRSDSEIRPPECFPNTDFLRFKFTFQPATTEFPYGFISYNYARMFLEEDGRANASGATNSSSGELRPSSLRVRCVQATDVLRGRWKLYFLDIKRSYRNFSDPDNIKVTASAPFRKSWTHPRPKFHSDVTLCVNGTPTAEPLRYEKRSIGYRVRAKKTTYFPGEA